MVGYVTAADVKKSCEETSMIGLRVCLRPFCRGNRLKQEIYCTTMTQSFLHCFILATARIFCADLCFDCNHKTNRSAIDYFD